MAAGAVSREARRAKSVLSHGNNREVVIREGVKVIEEGQNLDEQPGKNG